MKSTGIIRKVDELGRIVIPIEIRNKFGINVKDPVEIFIEKNCVVLQKYEPNCIFCGERKNLLMYGNKLICKECCEKIKKL